MTDEQEFALFQLDFIAWRIVRHANKPINFDLIQWYRCDQYDNHDPLYDDFVEQYAQQVAQK